MQFFFCFSLRATLFLLLMNAQVYVEIDYGIHKETKKVTRNEKRRKKLHGFSYT